MSLPSFQLRRRVLVGWYHPESDLGEHRTHYGPRRKMFVSPLPRDSDIPSVTPTGQTVLVANAPDSPQREAEQRRSFKKYPGGKLCGKATLGENTGNQWRKGASVSSVQRLGSVDPENGDVNLTASLETFIAGVQGQQTKTHPVSVIPHNSPFENGSGIGEIRIDSANNLHGSREGETREGRAGSTMDDYGRSSYAQSALGSVFPEAYAKPYSVTGGGGPSAMPASSSYQVVLSDGTSYPSAVFPAGEQMKAFFTMVASCNPSSCGLVADAFK